MRISIVTVVRNSRDRVGPTLSSVTGQTWADREVIVVDGLSTDGTLDVIRGFGPAIDRLVVEADTGIYDAMNKGIQAASGDWIIFMNAGDVFRDPGVLGRVAKLLDDSRPVLCGAYEKTWGGRPVRFAPRPLRLGVMPGSHQATFVRTEAARRHPFDPALRVGSDYDQICRITGNQPSAIQFTDMTIAIVEGEGFSMANSRIAHRDYREVIIRHAGAVAGWWWYARTIAWTSFTRAVKAVAPVSVIERVRQVRGAPR